MKLSKCVWAVLAAGVMTSIDVRPVNADTRPARPEQVERRDRPERRDRRDRPERPERRDRRDHPERAAEKPVRPESAARR